jgi:hypothetical protein
MAFFNSSASKFERAMRALLILQGKGTWADTYICNQNLGKDRILPNRTMVVSSFSPTKPWRPEGVCQMEIQHHFDASAQDGINPNQPRVALDTYLGHTFDTLNLGGVLNDTDMGPLADAITLAGRWLAMPDPNGKPGDAADQIVQANLDMVNFRCDWVKFSTPLISRGNETDTTNWVEIIHLSAFVSHSNVPMVIPFIIAGGQLQPVLTQDYIVLRDTVTGLSQYVRSVNGQLQIKDQ